MLHGLWHWTLIGGHHYQSQINAAYPGNHGIDKAAVAWDINKANSGISVCMQIGITQIYRQPPSPFFLEAIGINTGEMFYNRGLAMINMTSCRH
jgi:hypothetical protein